MLYVGRVSQNSSKHRILWSLSKASIVTASQLRSQFLCYFEKNGHKILPGSSVIPTDDLSLLFVNAGMNQFKKYYLGEAVPYIRLI